MLIDTARFITDNLVNKYCRDDGLLIDRVNCLRGVPVSGGLLIDELGDFVQYVTILGQKLGRKDYVSWGLHQIIRGSEITQAPDGLIYPHHYRNQRLRTIRFFPLIRIGDTIWGLSEMYRIAGDSRIKAIFDKLLDGILKYALIEGLPSYGCFSVGPLKVPLPVSETMTSGYIIESMLEMYKETGDEFYKITSSHILEHWINISSFRKHSVFLRKCPAPFEKILWFVLHWQFKLRGRPGMNENIMVKGDTYLIFALLNLYRETERDDLRDAILSWREAVAKNLTAKDGRFFNSFNIKTKNRKSVLLEENHSVIEAMLDIHYDLGDEKALDLVVKCTESWLARQYPSGLIANKDTDTWAEIDPLLDFAINLLKLAELTADASYRRRAEYTFYSLLEHFRLPFGFCEKIDTRTLKPISPFIHTKYLGLLIKGLLIFDHVSRGGSIFKEKSARLLATDR